MNDDEVLYRANEIRTWFIDIEKAVGELVEHSRRADERTRTQARVHADGYQKIATALERGLERGFREIADAIRASK